MNFMDPRISTRVWDKCVPVPDAGCWLWIQPYGRTPEIMLSNPRRKALVKRLLYETAFGPALFKAVGGCISACVNPHHHIAGTKSEIASALRAKTYPKENRKKL